MGSLYNTRCPAVKRILNEAKELRNPTEDYYAQPLDEDLFEWHFTVRGPTDTEYEEGIYHGRITLPPDYPLKPPNIIFLTPSGRFQTNDKLCLSISGHHPETWQPSWSIRTAILAIIGFMPTPAKGTLGGLDYSPPERVKLAKESKNFSCPNCGAVKNLILNRSGINTNSIQKEASEISAQMSFKEPSDNKEKEENSKEEELTVRKRDIGSDEKSQPLLEQQEETMSLEAPIIPQVGGARSQNNLLMNILVVFLGSLLIFLCLRRLVLVDERLNSDK